MKYDVWVKRFIPQINNAGEIRHFETFGMDWQIVRNAHPRSVFTWVSGDGDFIVAGRRWVNRVCYFITEKPWSDETLCIPLNQGGRDD